MGCGSSSTIGVQGAFQPTVSGSLKALRLDYAGVCKVLTACNI
jgi:hypothetical protein